VAAGVLKVLKDQKLAASLRTGARAFAEAHLDIGDYLNRYRGYIEEITGKPLTVPVAAVKKPTAKAPAAGGPARKAKAKAA
jgi:hypothetical protein